MTEFIHNLIAFEISLFQTGYLSTGLLRKDYLWSLLGMLARQ